MLHLDIPGERQNLLLHCCCAPCSGAVVECLVENGIRPALFFSNSNITPYSEYELRRSELERYAAKFGLEVIDDEYDHEAWLDYVLCRNAQEPSGQGEVCLPTTENGPVGAKKANIVPTPSLETDGRHTSAKTCGENISTALANAPERGPRCQRCFEFRLRRAARYAASHGFDVLTTTLASSRWKSLEQVDSAGRLACEGMPDQVGHDDKGDKHIDPPEDGTFGGRRPTEGERSDVGGSFPRPLGVQGDNSVPPEDWVLWWNVNWRKGGLQERRGQIIREQQFYNQTWCGCEFCKKHDGE